MIAAISTEGFHQLYTELEAALAPHADDPRRQLHEGIMAYVRFAMENADTFNIMFSGVLEKEKEYPAFVDISQQTFKRVVDVVTACQQVGILRASPPEVMAVAVWGQVHGIVSLALEGQISHSVLESHPVEEIVEFAVEQIVLS